MHGVTNIKIVNSNSNIGAINRVDVMPSSNKINSRKQTAWNEEFISLKYLWSGKKNYWNNQKLLHTHSSYFVFFLTLSKSYTNKLHSHWELYIWCGVLGRRLFEREAVCMFINKALKFSINLHEFCKVKHSDVCAIHFELSHINILVTSFHRSLSGDIRLFLNRLEVIIKKNLKSNFKLIACGDMMVNCPTDTDRKGQLDWISNSYHLFITNNFCTNTK